MIDIRGTGAVIGSRVNDCLERSTIDSCVGPSPFTWNRPANASNVQNCWNLCDERFYAIFRRKFKAKHTKKQNFRKQFYQEFWFFIDVSPPVWPASRELTVQGRPWTVLPTRSSSSLRSAVNVTSAPAQNTGTTTIIIIIATRTILCVCAAYVPRAPVVTVTQTGRTVRALYPVYSTCVLRTTLRSRCAEAVVDVTSRRGWPSYAHAPNHIRVNDTVAAVAMIATKLPRPKHPPPLAFSLRNIAAPELMTTLIIKILLQPVIYNANYTYHVTINTCTCVKWHRHSRVYIYFPAERRAFSPSHDCLGVRTSQNATFESLPWFSRRSNNNCNILFGTYLDNMSMNITYFNTI